MSTNLTEFATDTKRVNYRASAVGLVDLKSTALATLLEEMGLASPERFTWTLRSVTDHPANTNYNVIKRNFDPVTLAPSSYVNGTLYTYVIIDPVAFFGGTPVADAVELPVDPLAFQFTSVAAAADPMPWAGGALLDGEFFTGITRDDAGCLRYIYRPNNYNIENLITGTTASRGTASGSGSPWSPVGGFGGGTNNFGGGTNNTGVTVALRPGVDKILFKPAKYDSVFGNFLTITNFYKDTYITNSHRIKQTTQRVLVQPDILFGAADIGAPQTDLNPMLARTINWVNNDLLNGQLLIGGPGIISPQVVITFSKVGPSQLNINPFFLDEFNFFIRDFRWGSFDGTTNEPIVYPIGSTIADLEQQVLNGH